MISLRKVSFYYPGKLSGPPQHQLAIVVPQFQLLVKAGNDPILLPKLVHFLEHPKLVNLAVTGPLDDIGPVLEFFLGDVEVQLVHVILDHINLSSLVDIPPLIIPVVGLIYDDL